MGQVMTPEAISCLPEGNLDQAPELMSAHQKSRILICDDGGKLVGLISLSDAAEYESEERTGETFRDVTEREIRPG